MIKRIISHSMRAYYVPLIAGIVLSASAFMPLMVVGEEGLGGVPTISSLGVLGLAILAVVLATLSVITRKNSRHPLLVVGLVALGLILVSGQWMEREAADRIWAQTQALVIVQGGETTVTMVDPTMALGGYLALAAVTAIVLFGMTIIIKRVPTAYVVGDDDDA